MTTVDYNQTAEDHQSFLVLLRHTGTRLSWKHFEEFSERIYPLRCVTIPGQKRDMWVRYKTVYLKENNEWGDFQTHRKALGLICVGKCSNKKEFDDLFESYKKEKENYALTLYNSRLIVFGMNTDGSHLSNEQRHELKELSPSPSSPPLTFKIDKKLNDSEKSAMTENQINTNQIVTTPVSECDDPLQSKTPGIQIIKTTGIKNANATSPSRNSTHRPHNSNSINKDNSSSEVVFYPNLDSCSDLEERIREFVTSLFFVLEGKRLDRSFERPDRVQLLCAPFEKKDYVGVDTDTKSFKKKCQGRLRKYLADLCLQAGLAGEAMLHYTTAIDILKAVNDYLWIGACYEGICSASVILTYVRGPASTSTSAGLRRNQSFSGKQTTLGPHDNKNVKSGGTLTHSYANGLQDLPETSSKSCLNPVDIIDKYKEALMYYSKYKNSGMVEMEASFKACRVLIIQQKYLQASDFLQNVVYISLQLSDDDKIQRYRTLSTLYTQIGFHRKAAFFKRVAAMQCVAPQNPAPNWALCYQLILEVLEGYRIYLQPQDASVPHGCGCMNGWPVIQTRVLHELIYSARRMGNLPLAIRHMVLLLHSQLDYLTETEKCEIVASLVGLTSQCEGTTQPLTLESGVVVPHIPLISIPLVKSFQLLPLAPHLEPRHIEATPSAAPVSVFIFTPLSLGPSTDSSDIKAGSDVDFCWVEGDVAEVQLRVHNPMPEELKMSHIGLLSDGAELDTFPANPSIPPHSGPYLVKLLSRPSAGELNILGYTTKVYGVRSNCMLRDCPQIPQPHFKVKVVPALPQVQLSSSLAKSASFLSFGEEANVVTSGAAEIYTGQSLECLVTLQNSSKLPVEMVSVSLEGSKDTKDLVSEIFEWNSENINSHLPLGPACLLCFTLGLYGVATFLPHTGSKQHDIPYDVMSNTEGKSVEAILKVQYSGGPGLEAGYCRCCALALTVDILPSVVFHRWNVLPSESADHCHLVLDVQNVTDHHLELHHSAQCLHLQPGQLRRIVVQVERCAPVREDAVIAESRSSTCSGYVSVSQFSQYLATCVDIRWAIPTIEKSGKVCIDHLVWTEEQKQLVYISPVSWDVRVNGELYSPLRLGALEYTVGDVVDFQVNVNIKASIHEEEDVSGVLILACCQYCDNGRIRYNIDRQVSTLGVPSLVVPRIVTDSEVEHFCSYMFHCPGSYKFKISMKVKGHSDHGQVWKCGSVVEINVID